MFEQINPTVNTFMTSEAETDRKMLESLLDIQKQEELCHIKVKLKIYI